MIRSYLIHLGSGMWSDPGLSIHMKPNETRDFPFGKVPRFVMHFL